FFLRALLSGGSLVLSSAGEALGDFLGRAGAHGVTHISGTPSHWRRALMSPAAHRIAPRYVRLSGEIADQAILDHLRACYPAARIAHAFASTEAGVAFDVDDGLAGFPASLLERPAGGVDLKVEAGSLRIRSARTATRYLESPGPPLVGRDGFVDTGDMVERRGDRLYFVGRRGGIINVGGLKVHPEEVEAVINGHPHVRMSLVRTRKNALTGALVVADVVLKAAADPANGRGAELEGEILRLCRDRLPRHKVPVAIHFVPALPVAPTGKLVRPGAEGGRGDLRARQQRGGRLRWGAGHHAHGADRAAGAGEHPGADRPDQVCGARHAGRGRRADRERRLDRGLHGLQRAVGLRGDQ